MLVTPAPHHSPLRQAYVGKEATRETQGHLSHLESAIRLHTYLSERHWREHGLLGPDPGIRFNYRLGRFIKSYLSWLPWNDDYYYLQAQGYWTLGNWRLFVHTGEQHYANIAEQCSLQMITHQRSDGAWEYPNHEWKGRIATAEGTWAALGLLESYQQTKDTRFLESALRWYQFLCESIGFHRVGNQLAVNYFSHSTAERVPNNTAFVLRFLAELHQATGDDKYLQPSEELLNFLHAAQQPSGEFPYTVEQTTPTPLRLHFQCYQYHAFQCLDLLRYYEISRNINVVPLITQAATFLSHSLAPDGHVFYECDQTSRRVTYHTAAVAAALSQIEVLGELQYRTLAQRAYTYIHAQQHEDGSFSHSANDYHLLGDSRSYPRYLSMILYHLLLAESRMVTRNYQKEETHLAVC